MGQQLWVLGTSEVVSIYSYEAIVTLVNPSHVHPAEADPLLSDPSMASVELGWTPRTTLEELCG